jgi:hypothetical protein
MYCCGYQNTRDRTLGRRASGSTVYGCRRLPKPMFMAPVYMERCQEIFHSAELFWATTARDHRTFTESPKTIRQVTYQHLRPAQ